MKTNFPTWFIPSRPPALNLLEPQKQVPTSVTIRALKVGNYDSLPIDAFQVEGTELVHFSYEREDDEITIDFCKIETKPNPNYDYHVKRYEEGKARMAEWERLKKIWDEETAAEDKEERRKKYEELRKEFG